MFAIEAMHYHSVKAFMHAPRYAVSMAGKLYMMFPS